jgi:hypothetical protein
MHVAKDGRWWRIGTAAEVDWIASGTNVGRTITAAIPPVFDAYATFFDAYALAHLEEDQAWSVARQEQAVVDQLVGVSGEQSWWLGYLDTGAHDVVFPRAPRVSLYSDWSYVLVEAGVEQALSWRVGDMRSQYARLPDLFFPADRSWLVSALWDDTWTCVGGPEVLIAALEADPAVRARRLSLTEDATPPGHDSY